MASLETSWVDGFKPDGLPRNTLDAFNNTLVDIDAVATSQLIHQFQTDWVDGWIPAQYWPTSKVANLSINLSNSWLHYMYLERILCCTSRSRRYSTRK